MGRRRVFDDVYSFLHSLTAFTTALVDPVALLSATLVFIAYQLCEREERGRKRGDFVEWMIGLLIGSALRFLTGVVKPW